MAEGLPVPTQGDCVDLNTRVNFHGHELHAIFGWKLEVGVMDTFPSDVLLVNREPSGIAVLLML